MNQLIWTHVQTFEFLSSKNMIHNSSPSNLPKREKKSGCVFIHHMNSGTRNIYSFPYHKCVRLRTPLSTQVVHIYITCFPHCWSKLWIINKWNMASFSLLMHGFSSTVSRRFERFHAIDGSSAALGTWQRMSIHFLSDLTLNLFFGAQQCFNLHHMLTIQKCMIHSFLA